MPEGIKSKRAVLKKEETAPRRRVRRPISRVIVGLALLVLGAVAGQRLPLSYLPSWSFPELTVQLTLPQIESLDLATRSYLDPIEGAIRSLGGVRDMLGDVNGWGGRFRVRFGPGVDVETKTARLDSELESIRRRLPPRASLDVAPVAGSGGEMSNLVWLESAPNPRLLDALRALPEVQSLEVAGERVTEMRIRAHGQRGDLASLTRATQSASRKVAHLGGGQWLMQKPSHGSLLARPVALQGSASAAPVPLAALADFELRQEPSPWTAHVDGEPGPVLLLSRHPDASPLALGHAVRRQLEAYGQLAGARFLVDEAEPLIVLLKRLTFGLILASLTLALWGWRASGPVGLFQGSIPLLTLAAALNLLWLAGMTLDVTTLPALAAALVAALLVHILRLSESWGPPLWALVAAAAVPVAVVLAGGPVGALLSRPASAFALALTGAVAAIHLLPPVRSPLSPRSFALLRWLMRRPAAVLLAAAALSYMLLTLFGDALMPKPGRLSPATADIIVSLRFTEETTVEEGEAAVERAEELLGQREEIEESWSVLTRGQATLGIKVTAEEKLPARLYDLAARLQLQLQRLGAAVQARPLGVAGGGEPLSFDDRLIEPPDIDDGMTRYRFLLRSPDARALRESLVRVEEMIRRRAFLKDHTSVHPDWGPPSEQWLLVPRRDADPQQVDAAVSAIAERAQLPAARRTLGLRGLSQAVQVRVLPHDAPEEARDAAEIEKALAPLRFQSGAPIPSGAHDPRRLFDMRESFGSPTLRRQRGSFVLPVVVHFQRLTLGERPEARNILHSHLRSLRWPAGVDRQLPRLVAKRFSDEKLRLIAIASTLPLLLLGLAICRLDSVPLGLATAIAPGTALVAVMPLLHMSGNGADELTWLVLSGTIAAVWMLGAEVAAGVRVKAPSRLAIAAGYRWLSRRLPGAAAVAAGWLLLLAVPTWGLSSDRHAWVTALRTGGLAGAIGIGAAFLLLPVLLRAADRLRFHDRQAHRRLADPPAWQKDPGAGEDGSKSRLEPSSPEKSRDVQAPAPPWSPAQSPLLLETRNLNKIYSNGFQALSQIDLSLEPGIIGLLGPNGAGKSTLLRSLCGLLEPTRGRVLFRGEPVTALNLPRYRRLVGFLPQAFNAYEGATVEAFLDFWALEIGIYDAKTRRSELDSVLDQVDLTAARRRKVRELSGGMRRRIGIARALLGSPPILIVDEPTTGLDVESRQRLRDSLLRAAGDRIILFSTHIASDIATTAARILILDQGRLQFDGPPDQLIEQARGRVFERLLDDDGLREFSAHYRVTTRVRTLEGIRVRAVATAEQEIDGEPVTPNLEEAYLAKLGQGTRAPGGERRSGSLLDLGL